MAETIEIVMRKIALSGSVSETVLVSLPGVESQSETEPYGLTVFLKKEPSASKIEDELQVNADMTFDLNGNLGILEYREADSKELIAAYER